MQSGLTVRFFLFLGKCTQLRQTFNEFLGNVLITEAAELENRIDHGHVQIILVWRLRSGLPELLIKHESGSRQDGQNNGSSRPTTPAFGYEEG